METVVATLTDRQQQIYQLRFVQELTGRQIAGRLGIADKAASNEATIVQGLIADGFGALILLQEGRTYCRELARIIDSAASTRAAATPVLAAVPAQTDIFTVALRQRIVNHFNDSSAATSERAAQLPRLAGLQVRRWCGCEQAREDFAGDVSLEAARDLGLGLALGLLLQGRRGANRRQSPFGTQHPARAAVPGMSSFWETAA